VNIFSCRCIEKVAGDAVAHYFVANDTYIKGAREQVGTLARGVFIIQNKDYTRIVMPDGPRFGI